MKKTKIIITITVLLLIAAFCFLFFKKRQYPPYNVLLITIDSLRPDHLGCYGYKRNTSPNIDRLAGEAALFTQAITQGPHTLASVPSFITSACNCMYYIDYETQTAYLNPRIKTLSSILKRSGYATALFTDHPTYFGRIKGIKDGIDTVSELTTNQPKELTRGILSWLRKERNKRFFLWAYYFGAHGPYSPSLPYHNDYLNDGLTKTGKKIPIQGGNDKNVFGVIPIHLAEDNITDVDYYIASYDGKIRIIDDQIGLLLDGIREMGLKQDTLIILMSDHGEGMGEHGYYFNHGFILYDEAIKVPLMMSNPEIIPDQKVFTGQVRLLDMVPTILDILGLKNDNFTEGESLLPCIRGMSCDAGSRYAFTNTKVIFSLRSQDWKLIYVDLDRGKKNQEFSAKLADYYKTPYELYDLKNDPMETNNLALRQPVAFRYLKDILDNFVFESNKRQIAAEKAVKRAYRNGLEGEFLDEKSRQAIKSLGYIQ